MAGTGTARLSAQEIARYRADGFVVPGWRIPPQRLAQMRRSMDELIERNPHLRPELLLNVNSENNAYGNTNGSRDFVDYASQSEFLDLLEQLIGPDIVLWDCYVLSKPPRTGAIVHWHQDSPYLGMIRPVVTATIWIAIDDCTVENGCMQMIPGSHQRGVLAHVRADGETMDGFELVLDPAGYNAAAAVPMVLQAGQFCIFHAHTVHCSAPNLSDRRRAALIFRYYPATSVYDRQAASLKDAHGNPMEPPGRPLYLVRGRDASGANDFVTGHPRSP